MKDKLLIIGASGHGKVCADIAVKMNVWNEISFLDDNKDLKEVIGVMVIGNSSEVERYLDNYDVFVAIGNNKTREGLFEKLENKNACIATLIHPNAVIGLDVNVGNGTAIMAGAVINSSTDIGRGCIINTGSTVDHDCRIGNFVHVSPGVKVAGTVRIGERTWLGIGSSVSNNLDICSDAIIGAGGVVVGDIVASGNYVGVPARKWK